MRIWISAFVLAFLFWPAVSRAQSPEELTRQALDLVMQRKCEAFYAQFAPEMKKAIALKDYASQVDQILAALGKPVSIGAATTQQVGNGGVTVTIPVRWSAATLNFVVSWNTAGQAQGTWFLNAAQPPAPKYEPPAYSNSAKFSARDITVGEDEWKLPGTLLVPKGVGPFPAVVLVHGSGPHDRDETVSGAKPFRDLAEGLATRGIAVLRYDKRTFVHAAACAKARNFTMTLETVDDAIRAAALLRTQPGIDPHRIFVLGHSQGGYVIPRIMQADPKLFGVIVMAGNARPLEELILDQTDYLLHLNGKPTDAQQAQLAALKRDPWLAIPGVPDAYKADLKGYNPVALAKTSQVPMLIMQGERDYQVTMKDFALWKTGLASHTAVTFQSFPKLNHLFVAGEGKSTPKEYEQAGHVAVEVIDAIAAWITRNR
jgi:dienelactone hydrolase